MKHCGRCGIELDGDDPNPLCGECTAGPPKVAVRTFNLEQHMARVNDIILERGFYIEHVLAQEEHEAGYTFWSIPYAFTVGRTLHKRPELLVSGTWSPAALQSMLENAVEVDTKHPITVGTPVGGVIDAEPTKGREPIIRPVMPIRIDPYKAQMYTAIGAFTTITAVQLLWPDREGRFPGEDGYAPLPNLQGVFSA